MMKLIDHKAILFLAAIILSIIFAGLVFAQSETEGTGSAESTKPTEVDTDKYKIRKPTYAYKSLGNRDPFRSLIQTAEGTETSAIDVARTPLESYNVSQLRLIAVVIAADASYALVILPDGKSYTVKMGMNLGLHDGVVTEIRSDEIVVEEAIKDHKGNLKLKEVYLKLRQEGDK
jgi:type IV pilus assembly protein PilP